MPYILRGPVTAVAKLCKMVFVTIKILATFVAQNLQIFLWRDLEENILGNLLGGYLNIMPA